MVVVIAILGILAAIAIPRLTGSRDRANWSAHAANIRTIDSAMMMYQAENGDLPNEQAQLSAYLKNWPTKPGTYTLTGGKFTANPTYDATAAAIAAGDTDWPN